MIGPATLALMLAPLTLQAPPPVSPQQAFQDLVGEFVAFHLYFNPVVASDLGASGYDNRLPDVSRTALQARAEAYQVWLDRLGTIDTTALVGDAGTDYLLMERGIRAELLELVEIRSWERDPSFYVALLDRALLPLLRNPAPPTRQRMDDLTSRMRQVATVLAEARSNVSSPPSLFTTRAADAAAGLAAVLRTESAAAFDSIASGPGKDDFVTAATHAVDELEGFVEFLNADLLPRSTGDVSLGATRLGWLLLYREHVLADEGTVLAVLENEIAEARTRLEAAAARLDGSRRPAEVVADLTTRGIALTAAEAGARQTQEVIRRHLFQSLFATVPSDRTPTARILAPHLPWETAHLVGPGSLSQTDGPATLVLPVAGPELGPDPAVAGAHILEHAFPGRYLESMYARRGPTRLRKVIRSPTLTGGWGLYAAGAALADGLDQPAGVRVAGLFRQLQALVQARAAVLIHARGQSIEVATDQLATDGLLTPAQAREAAARAAQQPLADGALGGIQLRTLRRLYLAQGDGQREPNPRQFHDAFLASSLPPSLAATVLLRTPDGAPLIR